MSDDYNSDLDPNSHHHWTEPIREHHKVFSFKEELSELLKEHSVDYNEDYLIT